MAGYDGFPDVYKRQTYDRAFAGRNRRYYSITEKGCERLEEYRHQWREYEHKVNTVLFGEAHT